MPALLCCIHLRRRVEILTVWLSQCMGCMFVVLNSMKLCTFPMSLVHAEFNVILAQRLMHVEFLSPIFLHDFRKRVSSSQVATCYIF